MKTPSSSNVTELIVAWGNGDEEALHKLIPLIEDELRRLAARYMRREKRDHTLQTTALVNEAYCRLIDQKRVRWQNRAHFLGIAASLMRRILLDHAKRRLSAKHGGKMLRITLDEKTLAADEQATDLLTLDEALTDLATFDPVKSRIVEMKFFGGLTTEEIANIEKVSTRTIEREWRKAKAWLHAAMQK
jgi:RNA polymerase sigma factor (TIGR02999 family)